MHHILNLARVLIGTAALGLFSTEPDYDEPAPVAPAWPDMTQVALIILAAVLFVANLGGVWWLAFSITR